MDSPNQHVSNKKEEGRLRDNLHLECHIRVCKVFGKDNVSPEELIGVVRNMTYPK